MNLPSPHANRYYVLQDKEPVPCPNLLEWSRIMVDTDPQIGWAVIGPFSISTVFLGVDVSFRNGPPQLFETMVFTAGADATFIGRCATWAAAEDMHQAAIALMQMRHADQIKLGLTDN